MEHQALLGKRVYQSRKERDFTMNNQVLDLSQIGRITDISTVRTDVTMPEVEQLIDIVKSFRCICASPMPNRKSVV